KPMTPPSCGGSPGNGEDRSSRQKQLQQHDVRADPDKQRRKSMTGIPGSTLRRLALAAAAAIGLLASGSAQAAEPIKIGFSMALSGGLASNGKAALLAMQMWAEKVNAKGGLIGRQVQLVHYDDQSNPSTVPGIYTKLIDVDKVDIVVSPYGTNLMAPAMPVIMQKKLTMMSLFGVGV